MRLGIIFTYITQLCVSYFVVPQNSLSLKAFDEIVNVNFSLFSIQFSLIGDYIHLKSYSYFSPE